MRGIASLEIVLIVTMVITVTFSAETRGVVCTGGGSPNAVPDPIPDATQQVVFQCALSCLKSGSASCTGFTMGWTGPTCETMGAGSGSRTDYSCTAM